MSDKIKLTGVMAKGYGQIPKMITRDKDLSIEAKGIYAYMASFAGAGESAYPRISTICNDLNISEDRYFRHRKPLIEKGYVTIKKNTKDGKFDNNVYVLNSEITVPSNYRHGVLPSRQNKGATNNKVLNNNKEITSKPSFHKEREIFDYYISKDIIKHERMTTEMRGKITTALKRFKGNVDEVKKIIDNYDTVFKSDEYFFNTKYGIDDLMRAKDLIQFSDERDPLYNFRINKKQNSNKEGIDWSEV